MAWSPFRRSNAGISWVEHPGDYANRISTAPATAPPRARLMNGHRRPDADLLYGGGYTCRLC
jgi:hypothetical protein